MRLRTLMAAAVMTPAVALAGPAAALSPSPVPRGERPDQCHGVYRTDTTTKNNGTTGADDWLIRGGIGYDWCWNPGPGRNYTKGLYMLAVGYNQEGTHMSCVKGHGHNRLKSVNFKPYFWDYSGRNWDRDTIEVPCAESTYNSEVVSYKGEKLFEQDHHAPRMKLNVKIDKLMWDVSATLMVALRKCDGEGMETCP